MDLERNFAYLILKNVVFDIRSLIVNLIFNDNNYSIQLKCQFIPSNINIIVSY